jgi:hypothetical protein
VWIALLHPKTCGYPQLKSYAKKKTYLVVDTLLTEEYL